MGHVLFHYCNFRWDIIISFPATTFLKRAGLQTSMRAISPPWATLDTICTTLSPFFLFGTWAAMLPGLMAALGATTVATLHPRLSPLATLSSPTPETRTSQR